MKRGYLLTALLFTAFMFPFFGNISDADALGNYQCGNKERKKHVNCLRSKLDSTPYGLTVPKGKRGLGKYGCGTKQRRKHVNCLRRLLDQHGPHLAKGGSATMNAPGMHPPMGQPGIPPMGDMDCVNAGNPTEVAACWNAKAHNGPPPGSMPPGTMMPPKGKPCWDPRTDKHDHPARGQVPCSQMPGANPNMAPPTGTNMAPPTMAPGTMPPGTTMPPMGDPCMVVPAGPDRDACYATAPAPGS